jgi:hypothetical protein
MAANDNNGNGMNESEPLDISLARAVRDLDREIQPTRDLWPGIERKIASYPQRHRDDWLYKLMPYGMAASLLVAGTALVLSLTQVGSREELKYATLESSIGAMQNEFVTVRNPSIQQFEKANQGLDPETFLLLRKNIEIIEKARKEIELALLANPENQRLIDMLMRVHQQELYLLNQSYVEPDSSI